MARADRKLFRVLGDEVCYAILLVLLDATNPLPQRELVRLLNVASSTISRRVNDLEDLGLVERASMHGPCSLVYESTTRELLRSASELMAMTHAKLSDESAMTANVLRGPASPEPALDAREAR